jgi:ectoine hydroxylase-related dioxygenase (phytanoyl-CoA dioxygenase family)
MKTNQTQKLDAVVFEALENRGYAIVRNFLPEAQRAEMAAALRRILKPWEQIQDDWEREQLTDKKTLTRSCFFPYPELCLNRAILNREAIAFSRRWLGTDDIHYRPGLGLVSYPDHEGGAFHIDNSNNSLLPPTESDRRHSQLNFWFCLEDVDEDQAPTLFVADGEERCQDPVRSEAMVVPGGSVAIFHNYTWHAASPYRRRTGQRYIWKFAYGRADHYWEGVEYYTGAGQDPHFRTFIAGLNAADRQLFRFPPPDHPYYTDQTLAALEEQYPGWNAGGEYQSNDGIQA